MQRHASTRAAHAAAQAARIKYVPQPQTPPPAAPPTTACRALRARRVVGQTQGLTAMVGGCTVRGFSKGRCGGKEMKPLPTTLGFCAGTGVAGGLLPVPCVRTRRAQAAQIRSQGKPGSEVHANVCRPRSSCAAGAWRTSTRAALPGKTQACPCGLNAPPPAPARCPPPAPSPHRDLHRQGIDPLLLGAKRVCHPG